jgi:5-hydroxyisourate hydrolase
MATTPTKDRITCHVLDTSAGRPARGVRVRLELLSPNPPTGHSHGQASKTFESTTDDDGRVKAWLPFSADNASGEVPVYTLEDVLDAVGKADSTWTLRFDVEAYFGAGETFFPEVAVTFRVVEGQHYHVPLLLSPYSYTTYRGS